jgi:hypothetical protein
MAVGRLYRVENGDDLTLVRAMGQAQAISHVTKGHFKATVATPDDVEFYLTNGGDIEVTTQVQELLDAGQEEVPADVGADAAAESGEEATETAPEATEE